MKFLERITNRTTAPTNASGLPTYDIWYLRCMIYHLLVGYPISSVDSQQIYSLPSVFIYHCFHFFEKFMLLRLDVLSFMFTILASLGIDKNGKKIINY